MQIVLETCYQQLVLVRLNSPVLLCTNVCIYVLFLRSNRSLSIHLNSSGSLCRPRCNPLLDVSGEEDPSEEKPRTLPVEQDPPYPLPAPRARDIALKEDPIAPIQPRVENTTEPHVAPSDPHEHDSEGDGSKEDDKSGEGDEWDREEAATGGYGGPRHVDYGETEEAGHPVIPGMPAAAPPRKEPKKEKKDTKRTKYVPSSAL